MKKLILFAAVAGLGLISASPPDRDHARPARGAERLSAMLAHGDRPLHPALRARRAGAGLSRRDQKPEDEATEVMAMPDDEAAPAGRRATRRVAAARGNAGCSPSASAGPASAAEAEPNRRSSC